MSHYDRQREEDMSFEDERNENLSLEDAYADAGGTGVDFASPEKEETMIMPKYKSDEALPNSQVGHHFPDGGSGPYYHFTIWANKVNDVPMRVQVSIELEDIIEALDMNFSEGNIMKALVRRAQWRLGKGKVGTSPLYDAKKCQFYSNRLVNLGK